MSVAAFPANAIGYENGNEPAYVTTGNVTCIPTGGTAPYTYAWSVVVSATSVTINNPTMATTSFSATVFNEQSEAQAQCLVTDALGATAAVLVAITFIHENSGGGLEP